jgi:hypothetical protein
MTALSTVLTFTTSLVNDGTAGLSGHWDNSNEWLKDQKQAIWLGPRATKNQSPESNERTFVRVGRSATAVVSLFTNQERAGRENGSLYVQISKCETEIWP